MSELWKLNMEDYNLNELKQLFELRTLILSKMLSWRIKK